MTASFGQDPDGNDPTPAAGQQPASQRWNDAQSPAVHDPAAPQPARATVLIVEDERIFALDLSRRLTEFGYDVVGSAANGDDALAKADALRPDLVLMDIRIDGVSDGIDVARAIYRDWDIPIVFLTAFAEQQMLDRAREALPFGYLTKPVNWTQLNATLQIALARHSANRSNTQSHARLLNALNAGGVGVLHVPMEHLAQDAGTTPIGGGQSAGESPPLTQLLPEGRSGLHSALRQAAQSSGTTRALLPFLRKDLRIGALELLATAARAGDGVVGLYKDVSHETQRAEDFQRMEAMFESASEGIFALDATFRITKANPAFARLTSRAMDSILEAPFLQVLNARWPGPGSSVPSALLQGRWQGEVSCQRDDGQIYTAWLSVTPECGTETSGFVGVLSDISARQRQDPELTRLAYHDLLTGLPNRLLLMGCLDELITSAKATGQTFAVVYVDLDGFKAINDAHGHSQGDALLQTVADRISRSLRSTDFAARIGGDEFVLLISELVTAKEAAHPVLKVLARLAEPMEFTGHVLNVSASAGIATFPLDGGTPEELLKAADGAMYAAKALGRNRIHFASVP